MTNFHFKKEEKNKMISSYQKRLKEITELKNERDALLKELHNKGNIFFMEKQWLGIEKIRFGTNWRLTSFL